MASIQRGSEITTAERRSNFALQRSGQGEVLTEYKWSEVAGRNPRSVIQEPKEGRGWVGVNHERYMILRGALIIHVSWKI